MKLSIPNKLVAVAAFTVLTVSLLATVTTTASSLYTRPFNSGSIWNRPVGANPVLHPRSTQMIQLLSSTVGTAVNIDGINGAWSVPVYYAGAGTPLQRVCDANRYRPCEMVPFPSGVIPSPDADGKTVIVDLASNPQRAWSFYTLRRGNGTNGDWEVGGGNFGWGNISSNGDGIHNYGGGMWGGRVTGWNYYSGLIHPEEISQGRINHALAFFIPAQTGLRGSYVWPANGTDGTSTSPNAIPLGSRIQLDPSLDVNTLPLSASGKIIARALQEYGGWIADTGVAAAVDAREFVALNSSGQAYVDASPWQGLLTYRDLYGIPVNRMRIIQANPADFYQESGQIPNTPTNTPPRTTVPTNTPTRTIAPTNTPARTAVPSATSTPVRTSAPAGNLYRAINLAGPALTIDGEAWEAQASASNFSATASGSNCWSSPALNPVTDVNRSNMIRCSVYGGQMNLTFQAVPNGQYDVYLHIWEDNVSVTTTVSLEGRQVQVNYPTGAAGAWRRLGPWPVQISDGTIVLTTSGYWVNLSGIEVRRSGSQAPTFTPTPTRTPTRANTATVVQPTAQFTPTATRTPLSTATTVLPTPTRTPTNTPIPNNTPTGGLLAARVPTLYETMDDGAPHWQVMSGNWTLNAAAAYGGRGLGWRATGGANNILQWRQQIDLRNVSRAFLWVQSSLSSSTPAQVQVSTDGINWANVATIPPSVNWQVPHIILTPYAGRVIQLRFVWTSSRTTDVWRFDDLTVAGG